MDIGMAQFLLSNCLPAHQDDEFANPLDDPPAHARRADQNLVPHALILATAASAFPKNRPQNLNSNVLLLQSPWSNDLLMRCDLSPQSA
jgi:hypothetical protein